MRKGITLCLFGLCAVAFAFGQASSKAEPKSATGTGAVQKSRQDAGKPKRKLTPQQQFVMHVVQSAVALPQADPQDRLRVLTAAATLAGPVSPAAAKKYTTEGAKIEADLIAAGQKPAVSILSAGHFNCASAAAFVDQVPAAAAAEAEQSLINIMISCPQQAKEGVRRKAEAALQEDTLAPRVLLALMESTGPKTAWSQATFSKMFQAFPKDPEKVRDEAPNYAAMFNRMAPEIDKDVARDSGLRFLEWLAKRSEGGPKNIAVNMTSDTLKQVLGEEDYEAALRTNVVARDAINSTQAKPVEVEHPEEENVSVLAAMGQKGRDRTDEISKMAPSLRAREAAAHGYASGTAGDTKTADRYFDIAFSALEEVWGNRSEQANAPAVIQEVSEAAAQVNAVAALKRAQGLGDPSSQALGMLAVARVVLGQSDMAPTQPPRATAETSAHPIR